METVEPEAEVVQLHGGVAVIHRHMRLSIKLQRDRKR